jgi:hypothetical protein
MSNNVIHNVFDEAQKSQKLHKISTQKLHKLLTSDRAREAFMVICQCYDKILSCSKKEAAAELTVKFFVTLVATATEDVFLSFVNYLLERSNSLDKIVRFRSCQTISCIFKEFPEESEIDNTLWDALSDTLLPRLRDKCPNVRMWSLKALKDLQDPSNAEDPILQEFLRLLQSDTSKDVRIAAIECILPSKLSLSHLIDRLGDVKTEVRLAATQKLLDMVEINHLTQKQRGIVIKYALNDREEVVREKALELMVKWLHSSAVDNSVPKLLYLVGLVGNAAESELTAWSLIEAGTQNKQFTLSVGNKNKVVSLQKSVENDVMNWQRSFTSIPPAELLWTLLRCDFYFKSLSSDRYLERVENFLPDTVVLCELLGEGHTLLRDEDCPQLYELSMELLLRITAFVDTSDIAGSKALVKTCKDMVKDLQFLETLVEPVLTACCKAMTSVGDNVGEDMSELSQELWPSVFGSEMSEDDPFKPKNPDIDLAQLRSLQVAAWTIQNQTANKKLSSSGVGEGVGSPLEAFIPMVLQSLQQPIKDLRSAALRCLGLLGISSEKHCEAFAGIVLQVASANQEDSFIRCQAIESLTDMAMVHSDALISQDTLVTLMTRMVDCGTPLIQRIAAEASAKLLFSGRIVKSPPLLARLIRMFFSPIESDDSDSESYANFSNPQSKKCEASKGSEVYLDQLLSVFFPAFFSAGGDRGDIVVDSVVPLISNCAMNVRDGVISSIPLQKISEHLLSWCAYIPQPSRGDEGVDMTAGAGAGAGAEAEAEADDIAEIVRKKLKVRLCSVCFKEILSLDASSPSSKQLLKDLTKLFAVLTPCDWVTDSLMVESILKACRFVKSQCILDKVSSKHLATFYIACQEFAKDHPIAEKEESSGVEFFSFAPGLTEMLSGWSDDEEEEDIITVDDDADDYNDKATDDPDPSAVPVRTRISRASKQQAQSRISKQLGE